MTAAPLRSATALALTLLLLLAAPASAQPAPSRPGPQVALLVPDRPVPGDLLTIEASGLPEVDHVLRIEAPDGSESTTVTTAIGGRLRAEATLRQVGRHVVWLEGPGIEARFSVTVEATAPPISGPGPARPEAVAPDDRPADGPEAPPADGLEPRPVDPPELLPAAPDEPAALLIEDNTVIALEADGDVRWRLAFPLDSGTTRQVVAHLGSVWVAHGHQVLELAPEDGRVRDRVPTSGDVIELRPVGTGLLVASEVSAPGALLRLEARLADGRLTPPAVFDPQSDAFDSLEREARVGDPTARLAVDPTNPFLHLHAAVTAPTEVEREAETATAIATARTFFDLARLARAFAEQEWWAAADEAMAAAAADFAARGYDPALLTSVDTHERYGFPLRPLQRALLRGDLQAAGLWARWLHALSGPDLPEASAELRAYAAALAAAGEREEAAFWRERAAERTNPAVVDALAKTAASLGRGGVIASAALMVAFLMLHLTLTAKYGRARALALTHAREAGRRVPPWPALWSIRFYSRTEKLVLVLVLAAAYTTIVLHGWVARGDPLTSVTTAGHLDGPVTAALWSTADGDPTSLAWVRAYRADRAGRSEEARYLLADATGGPVERALAALAEGEQVPTPSPAALRAAAAGAWTTVVADAFRQPQTLLDENLELVGLPDWSWPAQLVIFWLVLLWHLGWWVVPRPAYAVHAPRPWSYQLLALLVPGSGQADELYGILLIVPWALFGIDALAQLLGGSSPLGIPFRAGLAVLSVLYLVNALAWAIELASVRRRMMVLKATQPDLARAFGLKPGAAVDDAPAHRG